MSYFSENEIAAAMTVKLDDVLPEKTVFQEGIRRAPDRGFRLTQAQTEIALKNAGVEEHPKPEQPVNQSQNNANDKPVQKTLL